MCKRRKVNDLSLCQNPKQFQKQPKRDLNQGMRNVQSKSICESVFTSVCFGLSLPRSDRKQETSKLEFSRGTFRCNPGIRVSHTCIRSRTFKLQFLLGRSEEVRINNAKIMILLHEETLWKRSEVNVSAIRGSCSAYLPCMTTPLPLKSNVFNMSRAFFYCCDVSDVA
jgi:hypothetical protein